MNLSDFSRTHHFANLTRRAGSALTLGLAVTAGLGAAGPASPGGLVASASAAEDYLQRVNAAYADVSPGRRSDAVLFPVLAAMTPPPKQVSTYAFAALLPAKSPTFAAAAAWAQAPEQKAVLEALKKVTQETDFKRAYAFGQPYGVEGITPEMVRLRMYTELGDPPMLAAAQHLYMPALDHMVCLVNVEATRLAADGKVSDAIDTLTNLAYFARQMVDRQFFAEASWGMKYIAAAQSRIRDVAYNDLKGAKALDLSRLPDQIKRLSEENLGYLDLSRVTFPIGNRIAAEQVVARVFVERGGINDAVFASTMSRLGSTDRPLRLFAEASRWKDIAGQQGKAFETNDKIGAIYSDWRRRWTLGYYDSSRGIITEYSRMNKSKYAAIDVCTPDMGELFDLRQVAKLEGVGTRVSLALCGVAITNGQIPPLLTTVRPRWMTVIDADPYNLNIANNARPWLEYFIPMQKPQNEREDARPHEMQVYTANGEINFQVKLQNDVWVLYSLGTDNKNNGAKKVQNTSKVVQGADYIIWPPIESLYRQHLIDLGEVKVSE